jgi:hypothetical protein
MHGKIFNAVNSETLSACSDKLNKVRFPPLEQRSPTEQSPFVSLVVPQLIKVLPGVYGIRRLTAASQEPATGQNSEPGESS